MVLTDIQDYYFLFNMIQLFSFHYITLKSWCRSQQCGGGAVTGQIFGFSIYPLSGRGFVHIKPARKPNHQTHPVFGVSILLDD